MSTTNHFCTNCGKPVSEQAFACLSCGAAPTGHRKFCRQCGTGLNPGQVDCTRCSVPPTSVSPASNAPVSQVESRRSFLSTVGAMLSAAVLGIGALLAKARKGVSKGVSEVLHMEQPAMKSIGVAAEHEIGIAEQTGARAANRGASTLERSAVATLSHVAMAATEELSHSARIGQRLASLQPRIPAYVYARLVTEWQRNHANIQDCQRKLQNPSLPSYELANIQERIVAASEKNAEIERLVSQYG